MLSVVVLVSGGGSNLAALIEAGEAGAHPAAIAAVGSDRPDAGGLDVAREHGIPTFVEDYRAHASRQEWGAALLPRVLEHGAELTILSGFMRLLPPAVVRALAPRLINTHPAYLPEFPGAHAVRDALAAGATRTGASLIVVDDGVDSGPILARERVPVLAGDTERTLHERIKPVERRLLVSAVRDIADGTLDLGKVRPS